MDTEWYKLTITEEKWLFSYKIGEEPIIFDGVFFISAFKTWSFGPGQRYLAMPLVVVI
jgi:hypothetical protein